MSLLGTIFLLGGRLWYIAIPIPVSQLLIWSIRIIVFELIADIMKEWFVLYKKLVKGESICSDLEKDRGLQHSQDQLFLNFLIYCLPVTLFAAVPGIYMAFREGIIPVAVTDIICLSLLSVVTFYNSLSLAVRKVISCSIFYFLSIFLISYLGYIGPGIFYLFTITVLLALIFPMAIAYYSIVVNALILASFGLIIHLKLFDCELIHQYSAGKWIALSSNLIVTSIVVIVLIDQIFRRLQASIIRTNSIQKRYKTIFNSSPLPMWLFDTISLKFLDINNAAIRQYGYTREEFLSMTIKDIRPPDTVSDVENIVNRNKVTGDYYSGVAHHLKKNGDSIFVTIESNPIVLENCQARLVLSTDITAQLESADEILRANLQIKESESNLRAIFESANDGFVLLDANFIIKLFNTKATEYSRFTEDRKLFETGKSVFDFVESSRHQFLFNSLYKVRCGRIVTFDRKYRGKDEVRWIHFTLTPVYDDNVICGICITGRDFTARKTYIRQIEVQNKALRNISWMQSHLVRAPLARIMGITTLLMKETDPAERKILLNYLITSSQELDDIIKRITVKSSINYLVER